MRLTSFLRHLLQQSWATRVRHAQHPPNRLLVPSRALCCPRFRILEKAGCSAVQLELHAHHLVLPRSSLMAIRTQSPTQEVEVEGVIPIFDEDRVRGAQNQGTDAWGEVHDGDDDD